MKTNKKNRPPLNQVISFTQVFKFNSFSKAARALKVSAPVVSKRVSALEQYLGVQLFRRTTRRLEPTEAGLQLAESLGDVFEQIDHSLDTILGDQERIKGHLSIIMPTYFVEPEIYGELIPRFLEEHPDVHLQIRVLDEPLSRLGDSFDMLITGRLPERQLPDSQLVRRTLVKRQGAVYGAPAYFEKMGVPQTPADLSRHNCLSYLNRRWRFVSPTGEKQFVEANGNMTTNSTAVLKELAVQGQGLVYSIPSFFSDEVNQGTLQEVLQGYTRESHLEINLLYPRQNQQPARARAFMDALEEHFSKEALMP